MGLPPMRPSQVPAVPSSARAPGAAQSDTIGPSALTPSRHAVQAKLTISDTGDLHEQEADRIADHVMRMPEPPAAAGTPSRVPGGQPECECGGACSDCQQGHRDGDQEHVRAKPSGPPGTGRSDAPAIVHQTLGSAGQPLDHAARTYFEPRFGHDFSAVRIHADLQAAASADAVTARAYAVGQDIVFGAGQFAPGTTGGRWLLAHELAHVVQQSAAPGPASTLARQAGAAAEETETAEPWLVPEPLPVSVRRPPANGHAPVPEKEEAEPRPASAPAIRPPANQNAPPHETEPARDWRPVRDFDPDYLYSDQGANTNWGAGYDYATNQVEIKVLRYRLESMPRATMARGGSPPDFVTVSDRKDTHHVTAGERFVYEGLTAPSISFTPREFHVPDAIEHDIALATTLDQDYGVLLSYVPELLPGPAPRPMLGSPQLPHSFTAPNGMHYHPSLPPGAVIGHVIPDFDQAPLAGRLAAFRAAVTTQAQLRRQAQIAEKLAEAENFALRGGRRRAGPCHFKLTPPASSGAPNSNRHNAYAAYVAQVRGYAPIQGRNTEITWQTPEGVSYPFDTFNPADPTEVWEVKTQHEWASPLGMANAPYRVRNFDERIYSLEGQRLQGLYLASRCGLRFRYAVDSCEFYTGLSQAWQGLPPVLYIPPAGEPKKNC